MKKLIEVLEEMRYDTDRDLILALESLYIKTQKALYRSNQLSSKVRDTQPSKQVVQKAIMDAKSNSQNSKICATESLSMICNLNDQEKLELELLFG